MHGMSVGSPGLDVRAWTGVLGCFAATAVAFVEDGGNDGDEGEAEEEDNEHYYPAPVGGEPCCSSGTGVVPLIDAQHRARSRRGSRGRCRNHHRSRGVQSRNRSWLSRSSSDGAESLVPCIDCSKIAVGALRRADISGGGSSHRSEVAGLAEAGLIDSVIADGSRGWDASCLRLDKDRTGLGAGGEGGGEEGGLLSGGEAGKEEKQG